MEWEGNLWEGRGISLGAWRELGATGQVQSLSPRAAGRQPGLAVETVLRIRGPPVHPPPSPPHSVKTLAPQPPSFLSHHPDGLLPCGSHMPHPGRQLPLHVTQPLRPTVTSQSYHQLELDPWNLKIYILNFNQINKCTWVKKRSYRGAYII